MLRCPPDLSISRPPLAPLPSFRVLSALLSRSKAVSSRSFMSLMPPAGRKGQQRTVTNLFHPGYLPPVWKTFLRETEPRPERSRPPAFSEESCQELPPNWHPALQGFTQYNPHDPASWPCYSHSLLCATNHHHFCKRPRITYCSAYHSPPGDMVTEC